MVAKSFGRQDYNIFSLQTKTGIFHRCNTIFQQKNVNASSRREKIIFANAEWYLLFRDSIQD